MRKRKVVRVAVVYAISAWVAVETSSVVFPSLLLPDWTSRLVVALALIGFPVALALAWAFQLGPEGIRREPGDLPATSAEVPRDADDRLDGWKRIARHLNRDVRTLRRWELNEGLPVHRLMHDKQGTVYAYRSELDAWLAVRGHAATLSPEAPAASKSVLDFSRRPVWFLVPVIAAVVAVLLYRSWPSPDDPALEYGEHDWILITQFDNRTGEEVLDGTVEYALRRELSNSQFVKVVSPERVSDALRLMKLPADTPIDLATGREVSLRDGEIRILISGRIEKLGDTYVISAELVNPVDGVSLVGFHSEAANQNEILPRISELTHEVRVSLGEGLDSIEASEDMLARVTTPSLEALKLYSMASRMMSSQERPRAIPVLEHAVRVDPDFASAHLLLVYALRDRGEMELAREHLRRAVELAEQTSERERLFILATYYRYLDDREKEIETYRLLIRLYPDHHWGSNNLSHLLEAEGNFEEAYFYRRDFGASRPNQPLALYKLAMLGAASGHMADSMDFASRAGTLNDGNPWLAAKVNFHPAHRAWIRGDLEEVVRIVEQHISSTAPEALLEDGFMFGHLRSLLVAVGKVHRFDEISSLRTGIGWMEALLDFDSGDSQSLLNYLDQGVEGYWDAALCALAGQTEQARRLIEDPKSIESLPPPFLKKDWQNFARGALAWREGRFKDAVKHLGDEKFLLNITAKYAHLFAMNLLARSYESLGRTDEAIQILESAELQKNMSIFDPGGAWMWMRNQVLLHQLYQQSGKSSEADELAGELLSVLRLADPDHPVLSEISGRSDFGDGHQDSGLEPRSADLTDTAQ